MKKIFLILISLLFLTTNADVLKGGVSEEYIPKGFFGSWGVISKMSSSNNPVVFNQESRDIWNLSGYDNTLVLENLESGAHSEIKIKEKVSDNRTLKFSRQKEVKTSDGKKIYKETVEFTLLGNNFSGTDDFIIEHYNEENKLIKKDEARYSVAGVRISGQGPN